MAVKLSGTLEVARFLRLIPLLTFGDSTSKKFPFNFVSVGSKVYYFCERRVI